MKKTDVLFLLEKADDLFETPEKIPTEIQDLLRQFEEEPRSYDSCYHLLVNCEAIGYTFGYGLDAEPYNLHKMDEPRTVFAFFPREHYFDKSHKAYNYNFMSYAHVGQHSPCNIDYAEECEKATEYSELKTELEGLGYNLNVLN